MAKVDVAVIGAGSAGLCAGALLAKEGKRVAVFDRSQYLGGRGMAVPDEGFKLNVGGHLLEDSGSGITKIFEYLGKHLGHGPVSSDMPVWDHETNRWGSIRDRYSGTKDELKKVITALLETPYEELDKWDDRSLREWMLQHTSDQGVIDLWEFIAVLECLTDEWYDHSASDNLYVRKMHYAEKQTAGYSFWPEKGWDGLFQDLADALTENGGELRLGDGRRARRDRERRGEGDRDRAPAADPPERALRGRADRGGHRDLDAARVARPQRRPRVGAPRLVRRADPAPRAGPLPRRVARALHRGRRARRGDRPQGARDLAPHAEGPAARLPLRADRLRPVERPRGEVPVRDGRGHPRRQGHGRALPARGLRDVRGGHRGHVPRPREPDAGAAATSSTTPRSA